MIFFFSIECTKKYANYRFRFINPVKYSIKWSILNCKRNMICRHISFKSEINVKYIHPFATHLSNPFVLQYRYAFGSITFIILNHFEVP